MPPAATTKAKEFIALLLREKASTSSWRYHVGKSAPTFRSLDTSMLCVRTDKKTLKPALFLVSQENKCYFLGTVGSKVQAFYVTHDDLAEITAAPIKNQKLADSLTDFVTTSGRKTIKGSPIHALSQSDQETVFFGSPNFNLFTKLKEARKAKGTPPVVHFLKCAAIKSSDKNQSILQVPIHDDCSGLSNKARTDIATALEDQLDEDTWDSLKSFLEAALPWDATLTDDPTANDSEEHSTETPPDDSSTASTTVPEQIDTKPKKSKSSKWDLDFDKKESPTTSKKPPESWEAVTKHTELAGKLRSHLLKMVDTALEEDKLSKNMEKINRLSELVTAIDKVEKANQTGTHNGKVKNIFFLHLPFTYDILLFCLLLYHSSHQMRKFCSIHKG